MLTGLIIPQTEDALLDDVLATPTAQRLIARGAALYLLDDGKTNVLAFKRPPNAFAKAFALPRSIAKPSGDLLARMERIGSRMEGAPCVA